MTKFRATAQYGDHTIQVESDTFEELHQALAGIADLNRDAAFLRGRGAEAVVCSYRVVDDNPYYGFQDPATGEDVTFGKLKNKRMIPFFPKGADGLYAGNARTGNGRSGGPRGARQLQRTAGHDADRHADQDDVTAYLPA